MLEQEQAIEALVSLFEDEVGKIVGKAQRGTLRLLSDRLAVTDGVIDRTQANVRVLRTVERLFKQQMRVAGYPQLVEEYVAKFNGQMVYFQDVLDMLGEQIGRSLKVNFGPRDKAMFGALQDQSVVMLHDEVAKQAAAAQKQAQFSIGNVKASELRDRIAVQLEMTSGRASAVADTALSTFYRTVADRGFQQVEGQLNNKLVMKYKYGGPRDKLTRPKCKEWLAGTAEDGWTREQISQLSNGQLPNVFVTCGGYRCRHQWLAQITQKQRKRNRAK